MPKIINLDPDRPRKKKKRKKRKIDYAALLVPPTVPAKQCPHTSKVQESSSCSQCMNVIPKIVHKVTTVDWWNTSEDDITEITEELGLDLDNLLVDNDDE